MTNKTKFLDISQAARTQWLLVLQRLWLSNRGDWERGGKGQKNQPLLHPLSFTWNLVHCKFYFKDKKTLCQTHLGKISLTDF